MTYSYTQWTVAKFVCSSCHLNINTLLLVPLTQTFNKISYLLPKHHPNIIHHPNSIMSGTSNVGNSQVYQADDQRTVPNSEIEQQKKDNRFHEGKENSHKANDSSKESLWSAVLNSFWHIFYRGWAIHRQQASPWRKGLFSFNASLLWQSKQMVQGLIILTSLQRQNEEEYEPAEVKQSKRDPTLPVSPLCYFQPY